MRYIDADKFIEWLDVGHLRSPSEICYCEGDVKTMIDMQPTADVAEVVRCKDCKHLKHRHSVLNGELESGHCRLYADYLPMGHTYRSGNDFCSYGKRREKNEG